MFSGNGSIKLDASSLFNEESDSNECVDSAPRNIGNFPYRPPITYFPTSNDSDNLPGFDISNGNDWHYPSSIELRTYQFVITERCLFQNCLVCIPTGLGKTLIAAVVLHNFRRWYPSGCVIFMAPTRPLVSQQMMACRDFTGLSISGRQEVEAIELTGTIPPQQRAALWSGSRVFFLTPQVIANDLVSGICPATSIRCIVIDEAHKATGNHAYCQVIRAITSAPYNHRQFRVVALSATPASDLLGAQAVIANLLISHIEVRTESSPDVREYCHQRAIETILVRLDSQLSEFRRRLGELARPPLQRLCEHKALWTSNSARQLDPESFAPFTLVKAREAFTQSNPFSPFTGVVHRDFRIATCLARALQLLIQYGLRPVYQFILTNTELLNELQDHGLRELITDLGVALGASESTSTMSQLPFVAGHPKLLKLRDVLIEHFSTVSECCLSQRGTRAIVFTQYRDSVADIMHMLKMHSPCLRPAVFVGQSSSSSSSGARLSSRKRNTQRDQLQVMQDFREGRVNILISTCIGEEGLDVGQVDLIVCFDAQKSPARLIQRLGRTGRKRSGRVVVLLTEGREQSAFSLSMARSNTVHNTLLQGQATNQLIFYPHNPRMVPLGLNPVPLLWQPLICQDMKDLVKSKTLNKWKRKHSPPVVKFHFSACEASALLSLGQGSMGDINTFTRRYSANRWISSIRESFQTEVSGPSTATWHLVASLRLLELHRRGRTHAMYHATGVRKIDMTSSLSTLIPPSMSQFTHAISEKSTEPSPSTVEARPKFIKPSVRFFRGLVSKTLMVNPQIDTSEKVTLPRVVSLSGISLEALNKAFENLIAHSPTSSIQSSTSSKSVPFDLALDFPMPPLSKFAHPTSPLASPLAKRSRTLTTSENHISGVSTEPRGLKFDKKLRFSADLNDLLDSS